MTERQISILLYMYNQKDWVTSEELSDYFNLNKKTIQHEVKAIAEMFSEESLISSSKPKGYKVDRISAEVKNVLNKDLYLREGKNSLAHIGSKIIILLLFYKEYVTMQELADSLYMSKTSISLEIDNVKRWIERYQGLSLEINRQKGIKIHGDELHKRVYCAIHITSSNLADIPFLESMRSEYLEHYRKIEKILVDTCLEVDYIITGEEMRKSARFITISLIRSSLGYTRASPELPSNENPLTSEIVEKVHNTLEYEFNQVELRDVELFLNQSHTLTSVNIGHNKETRGKIKDFLLDVSKLIHIDIDLQTVDMALLEDYINKKILREQYGNIVVNHYNEEIFIQYPLETYLVQRLMADYFPVEYAKELTYFSLFLTSIFEEYKKRSILLVSSQSVSTISYLKNFILNHFSYAINDMVVMPPYQYEHRKPTEKDYPILLTTDQKIFINENHFFLIPPILNKSDKDNIEAHIKGSLLQIKEEEKSRMLDQYYTIENIGPKDAAYEQIKKDIYESEASDDIVQTFSKKNLYKCSISDSEDTKITVYNFAKPIVFEFKKISRVIDVQYNQNDESNVLAFFETVSDIISLYK